MVGATGRKIRLQVRRPDTGDTTDLTSYTGVTISGSFRGAAAKKIDAAVCTIEVGTAGWVYFYPTAGQCDTDGDLICRLTLDPGTGTIDFSERFVLELEKE